MQRPRSLIFRSEALEHYIQSREQSILPRITKPPVLLCMWILLSLCAIVIVIANVSQVPIYAHGSGVVQQNASILIFLPVSPAQPVHLQAGMPIQLQMGIPDQTITSTIDKVETGILSPADAQKRYGFTQKDTQIITGPTIVASVKPLATLPAHSYAGSVVNVQVQVGTTCIISLLLSSATPNGE